MLKLEQYITSINSEDSVAAATKANSNEICKNRKRSQVVVMHISNPSLQEAEAGSLCDFKATLADRVSSRTARATQRNPVSKKPI